MLSPGFRVNHANSKIAEELFRAIEAIGSRYVFKVGDAILSATIAPDFFFYVRSGAFKTYQRVNTRDYILGFTFAGDLDCDPIGILGGDRSEYIIQAIAYSEVLVCKWADLEKFLSPNMYLQVLNHFLAQYVIVIQQRLIDTLAITAEERYKTLLRNHNRNLDLIPLSDLASYLGITRQSMSRIRSSKF
jgi:CRP-like cAMP-binding protein